MNLSAPFIKRPVMTTLIMSAILFFGIVAYFTLPVAAYPSVTNPTLQVKVIYPGATPEVMANRVASPLERQFLAMQGIQLVTSSSYYGETQFTLQFYLDVDINVAATETLEAIDKAQGLLPPDLPQQPTYVKVSPTDFPVYFFVLYSDTIPASKLYQYGYTLLGQQMETIEGVANLVTYGFPYAVRINIDPEAAAAKRISMTDISNAIKGANPDQPTGKLFGSIHSMGIDTLGQIKTAEPYNDLIIKYEDGAPVRLSDIGYAEDSIQNDKQKMVWRTKSEYTRCVAIGVQRQPGYNTVDVCRQVEAKIAEFRKEIPQSINIISPFNEAIWIIEAIRDVSITLVIAFVLVALVVFLYLGKFKESIIPILTLPVTLAGTFMTMKLLGYSIDILSMSALTLAIGFLIDDAIVVLENIVRFIQGGEKPFDGAMKGTKQISITVLSMTLCLGAVFIPMLFLGGLLGLIFHEFAVVILVAILFSGFVSLTFTPMLSAALIRMEPHDKNEKTWDEKINEVFRNIYMKILDHILAHKSIAVIAAILCVGGSLLLFMALPRSFLPINDLGYIQCFGETQPGTSPDSMEKYTDAVTKLALESPYVADIGMMESFPTDSQAMFFLNLIDSKKRPYIVDLMQKLAKDFKDVVGMKIFMKPFQILNLSVGGIESSKASYQYTMQGFDANELYAAAVELIEAMRTSSDFMQVSSDLQDNAPEIKLKILRDQLQSYSNLDPLMLENTLKFAYGETYISIINSPINQYYVILQVDPKYYSDPSQFNKLYIGTKDGGQVALNSVVEMEEVATSQTVNHINGINSVTISFDVAPGVGLNDALAQLEVLREKIVPKSIVTDLLGTSQAFQTAFNQLFHLLMVAIIVIYLVLGILYEDFLFPFAAISGIPIASIGALLSLMVTNKSLDLYSFVGIIMLLGIVMKNGILIVDFALENMRDHGMKALEAVREACRLRFRPILMTTLAATMGAVPIAVGFGGPSAQGRAPLGIVIVGGLIFSQAVALFIIPVTFIYVVKFKNLFKRKDLSQIK